MKHSVFYLIALPFIWTALAPDIAHACACGCGVFDVGTSGMLPSGAGGMVFLDYGFQDQDHNRSGS